MHQYYNDPGDERVPYWELRCEGCGQRPCPQDGFCDFILEAEDV